MRKKSEKSQKKDKKKLKDLCSHSGIVGTLCNAENCNGGCVYIKESSKPHDK